MTDTGRAIALGPVLQSHHRNMGEWKSYRREPAVIAAAAALLVCVLFWGNGLSGGLAFLHRSTDPMAALLGLYAMLGAVAVCRSSWLAVRRPTLSGLCQGESEGTEHGGPSLPAR